MQHLGQDGESEGDAVDSKLEESANLEQFDRMGQREEAAGESDSALQEVAHDEDEEMSKDLTEKESSSSVDEDEKEESDCIDHDELQSIMHELKSQEAGQRDGS